MNESGFLSSGTQALRPKARILRTFGDELISSETVAIIELVKNAYDADATQVHINFKDPLEVGKGMIEIFDNGNGMSLDTIQYVWMEPATPYRKNQTISKNFKRRVLGEKGIGRFAASRLGDNLEVITRNSDLETRVFFDWTQFDDDQKYLDEINVIWEESEPKLIRPGGIVENLFRNNLSGNGSDLTHGTILRIGKLRTKWDKQQLESMRIGLSRLISPLSSEDNLLEKNVFRINLQLPKRFNYLSGIVEPPDLLKNPHYKLIGNIDSEGRYCLKLDLNPVNHEPKIEDIKGLFKFQDGHSPVCGPFKIELRIWDREAKDLADRVKLYGSTLKDLRQELDNAAGINIYRNGFRVLPYGERGNDWLRLDLRRVQDPTKRLSNNQIIGYVLISSEKNPLLRDQSNREGIIESPALEDLRQLIKMALNEVELKRYIIRRSKQQSTTKGLFSDFDLTVVKDQVKKDHPEDKKLLLLIGKKEKDLKGKVVQVKDAISRYQRLATLGQLIDTILHEGRAPLSKIGNEVYLGNRDLQSVKGLPSGVYDRIHNRFMSIDGQSKILSTVFRKIEPFGGRKRGRPTQVILEKVIADAFSILDKEIAETNVKVRLPNEKNTITADPSEIQQVIINLLQNSIYWLREIPFNDREISVQTLRKDKDLIEIVFSDSGPGVPSEYKDAIFDPYFSTKPDGIGIGLTIAGEIINEYYNGSLELLDDGPLSGANFLISLRKRV